MITITEIRYTDGAGSDITVKLAKPLKYDELVRLTRRIYQVKLSETERDFITGFFEAVFEYQPVFKLPRWAGQNKERGEK